VGWADALVAWSPFENDKIYTYANTFGRKSGSQELDREFEHSLATFENVTYHACNPQRTGLMCERDLIHNFV
jgi:hypothetical protein